MEHKILRLPAVEDTTGLKRAMIYQMVQKGQFPSPVKLTAKAVGWRSQDVAAWIDSRPQQQ